METRALQAPVPHSCIIKGSALTRLPRHQAAVPPSRRCQCKAAPSSKKPDKVMEGLKDLAEQAAPYLAAFTAAGTDTSQPAQASSSRGTREATTASSTQAAAALDDWRSPVYGLIAVLVGVFLLSSFVPLSSWYLSVGSKFQWHQLVTSGFVSTNAMHLSETVLMVYTFGRVLERAYGGVSLWLVYLASAIGASSLAAWLLPATKATASLAMSSTTAAALGVYIAGVVWQRLTRKPLEVLVLTPWVAGVAYARYSSLASALVANGQPVGHLVHIAGAVAASSAVAGVLRVLQLIQQSIEDKKREAERQEAARLRAERNTADTKAVKDVLGTAAKAAGLIAKKIVTE